MWRRLLLIFLVVTIGLAAWSVLKGRDDCTVLQTIRLDDAAVEIVDEKCKEGLPHTTGPATIRMTRSTWDGPRRDAILAHERVHLAQKSHSAREWAAFYEREWGYKCYASPPSGVPAELSSRLRPNPDTSDSPWAVWRGRWLFFPAFGDDGSLRTAEVIVWDLENHRQVGIPDEWRDMFCQGSQSGKCPHQYEHPHEISAEWLGALRSGEGADGLEKIPAAAKLFTWEK